jgi:carboxypeptidase family protein
MARRWLIGIACMSCVVASVGTAQPRTAMVAGSVRTTTGAPLSGALVSLDSANVLRAVRTGAEGQFRFASVAAGLHELRVTAIGYAAADSDITVTDADLVIDLVMHSIQRSVDTIVVRARALGIYGHVLSTADFSNIPHVTVQILGTGTETTTDSAGAYAARKVKPGTYLVRFTHPDFAERVFGVTIPADSGYSLSPVLEPAVERTRSRERRASIMKEMDTRVRMSGSRSTLVPRAELSTNPRGDLLMAVLRSRSYLHANFGQPLKAPCVYIEGRPLPGWTLDAFSVGEIEAIEIHDNGTTAARRLNATWPLGAPCGSSTLQTSMRAAVPLSGPGQNPFSVIQGVDRWPGTGFVVLWLRR